MKKLSIEDIHKRLLELAKAFDAICTRHNIPYYMLGGTMLGAIRHKGFIPWDDDMDFGVPIEYYNGLLSLLNSELPKPFRCCTYSDNDAVYSPFAKIDDSETCIDDHYVGLPIEKKIGLNIDIFPLYRCNKQDKHIIKVRRLWDIYVKIYVESNHPSLIKRLIKHIVRHLYPIKRKKMLDAMFSEMDKVKSGPYLANVFGAWGEKETISIEYYGNNTKYRFEDTILCGLSDYDSYLRHLYGDYMQLPPENKRHIHADNIYSRCDA